MPWWVLAAATKFEIAKARYKTSISKSEIRKCNNLKAYVANTLLVATIHPLYTGCPRRNVRDFGRVFLMLNYTDITQNTYIQSWTVTEIMAREVWNFDSCYSLIDYHWQQYVVSVMLIAVRNIKVTCEWHKAIKLNYKNTRTCVIVVLRLRSTLRRPQVICYLVTSELPCCSAHTKVTALPCLFDPAGALDKYDITDGVQYFDTYDAHTFLWPLSP